ncbi:MAG: RdgB/HAM1 family non-canonical purine NTP pyrophosphatase [Calditrichaeota bacterium]|nr:RdgB/HAM1 family non-canonical purine NTP pyrophosphatase [Calditrichota bacterium]
MIDLQIATFNADKLREFSNLLEPAGYRVLGASALHGYNAPEETGATLAENALIKARALHLRTGQIAIADDTGLFVDALDGQPGVHAARFAGPGCSYEDNVRLLLEKLAEVPMDDRTARFETVIAVVGPEIEHLLVGTCEGQITEDAHGTQGFGYDPVFQPDRQQHTFAEMTLEHKNSISHRGLALQALRSWLITQRPPEDVAGEDAPAEDVSG